MRTPLRRIWLLLLMARPAGAIELVSPEGRLVLTFELKDVGDEEGCPVYRIRSGDRPVITDSRLGLTLADGESLAEGFDLLGFDWRSRDNRWRPVHGERSSVRDRHHEGLVRLRRREGPGPEFALRFRVYDEGVAFRYELSAADGSRLVRIAAEGSEFRFPGDPAAWATYSAQGEYERVPVSRIRAGCERPLTVQLAPDLWVALAEARLVDHARARFAPAGSGDTGVVTELGGAVVAALPLVTPWRVIMVASSPGRLLEQNDIILNLNDPCAIEDTSWIRPGKVIREVTLTTAGGKACVDFAQSNGLQFVEFDAGWYGHEYSDDSDATTVTVDPRRSPGPLDLPEVIRYARERGIGIILYVNRRALERQLDEILPLYRSWGVCGVKYGFVQVGSQKWTSWLHRAVRKAAEHRLMVDIHDEYRPTGYSRTYPNLMTQEGIRGDETSPSNRLTLTILFTRMLAGAGDNTICYYDGRVARNANHAYQLAKTVCLYSPWQFVFWYDRPAQAPRDRGGAGGGGPVIGTEPELEFFAHVPTVWDDTRVLHGEIGELAVLARRSGQRWFVGAMNGDSPRSLPICLDFLDPGRPYVAHIYSHDPTVLTRTHVRIERLTVTSSTVLPANLGARSGLAIRIEPADGPASRGRQEQ